MSIVAPLGVSEEQIADFCRRWQIVEFSLFGSALRSDFRSDSDVDVLVVFAAGTEQSLFELGDMEQELSRLFGRKVDLVQKTAIERSENYIRRRNILSAAQVIYAAR
jgi:uncharacterized protein